MKLPKSWNDLTVPQLIELENIRADKSIDEDFAPSVTRAYLIVALFTGQSYEKLESTLSVNEVRELISQMSFLDTLPSEKAVQKFRVNGTTYKVNFDITKLNGGEFIDMYELTKNPDRIMSNCAEILSIFCTPINIFRKKIDLSKEVIKADMLKAPVSVVYPLTVFFWNLLKECSENLKDYLSSINESQVNEMKKIKEEVQTMV